MSASALDPQLSYGTCRPVGDFTRSCRIGEGTYGTVYRAVEKATGDVVALKKCVDNHSCNFDYKNRRATSISLQFELETIFASLDSSFMASFHNTFSSYSLHSPQHRIILHNEKQVGFPVTSLREVRLLRRLSHPNCVSLKDVAVGKGREGVFLVFEYCEHDMASLCENMAKTFSESEVKGLMVQLLRAVAYLHDNWIVHRDLKLSNLLYNSRGELKLADFGLARLYGDPPRPMTPKGSFLYDCTTTLLSRRHRKNQRNFLADERDSCFFFLLRLCCLFQW